MGRDAMLDTVCLLHDAYQFAKECHRRPTATYRLQMRASFNLQDATRIVPYLRKLGISHLYMSSLLMARPGSHHGYDVMNHFRLNPELGTEEDLQNLVDVLHEAGMGILLDVVPNHMWIGEGNEWWMDVLENGPASRYAGYFDINWQNHSRERLRGKVLLPNLGEPYGTAIEAGRFQLYFQDGCFGVEVNQTRLPLDPRTYNVLIEPAWESLREERGESAPEVLELRSILVAIRNLARREESDSEKVRDTLLEIQVIKRRLRELLERDESIAAHFSRSIARLTGDEEQPANATRLAELLDAQAYRPCFWQVALDEINYRRFFEINDLAALAPEHPEVFEAIHKKPFEWLGGHLIDGLRIDHVDGLLDPAKYLHRLQNDYLLMCAREIWSKNQGKYEGDHWPAVQAQCESLLEGGIFPKDPLLYVVVEKILGIHETLPAEWSCNGTTGYEFLNAINGLYVSEQSAQRMSDIYENFADTHDSFEEIAFDTKLEILRSTMASELNALTYRLDRLAQMQWWSRDFTLNGLRQALEVMIASFPVYRTYVAEEPSATDRQMILRAARRARRRSRYLGREVFSFISDTLLMRDSPNTVVNDEYLACRRDFIGKFQQLTSPVMAKGVEDTAFYVYHRLLSLNEVGGEPSYFGRSPERVHDFIRDRASAFRQGLCPLSTHDTKRSEDSRARINVLSEFPDEWEVRIKRWRSFNQRFKTEVEEDLTAPDCNEEYLIYQSLIGIWATESPPFNVDETLVKRLQDYMTKALREAKSHTSWIHQDWKYEQAVLQFIGAILDQRISGPFLDDLAEFQLTIDPVAKLNSLSQTLLKCTAPGVPDTYQGTESWDYSLVDPDNRRPVEYERHARLLEDIDQQLLNGERNALQTINQIFRGRNAKLYTTRVALNFRDESKELFESGFYEPLIPTGPDSDHVFGFVLRQPTKAVIVLAPRLLGSLQRKLGIDANLCPARINARFAIPQSCQRFAWQSLFTNEQHKPVSESLYVRELFANCPVNLLRSVAE